MPKDLFSRYIWLVDTVKRRGRITRTELNSLWLKSRFCTNGETLCRRTFYNYKMAIAELFEIEIACDPRTFEYYIAEDTAHNDSVTDWLLNSSAVSEALTSSRDIADRILLENVPSAREHLATVFGVLRTRTRLQFDYHSFTRSRPTTGVVLEPYCARIFRQRWYVIGRNVKDNKLKTYALDRMSNATDTGEPFEAAEVFDTESYFRYSFGIVVTEAPPRTIVLRTDHVNAKYLSALPLHATQEMTVNDSYCLFTYRMQITDDLVTELLSMGSRVVVENPPELRERMAVELQRAAEQYNDTTANPIAGSSAAQQGSLKGHRAIIP